MWTPPMRFDLRTHETIILLAGCLGLVEQELARLVLGLEPSGELSKIFGAMVLGSFGLGAFRTARKGEGKDGGDSP